MAVLIALADKGSKTAALDDVSATEWRRKRSTSSSSTGIAAALDDVSATEWRNNLAGKVIANYWRCTR